MIKDYFHITFWSDLMCNKDIKSEQKVIGNWVCAPIIFKNSLKPGFLIRNLLLQFVFGLQNDISFLKKRLLIDYKRLLVYKRYEMS